MSLWGGEVARTSASTTNNRRRATTRGTRTRKAATQASSTGNLNPQRQQRYERILSTLSSHKKGCATTDLVKAAYSNTAGRSISETKKILTELAGRGAVREESGRWFPVVHGNSFTQPAVGNA
jgi:hypothetical protein